MRALFRRAAHGHGFRDAEWEAIADSVCRCQLDHLFETQVRGAEPIDAQPTLARLGLALTVDTVAAVDSAGNALPDPWLRVDFTRLPATPLVLVLSNPASAWSHAGLRTGDTLVAFNGAAVGSFGDLRRRLSVLRVGDTAAVDIRRTGREEHVRVVVTGYSRPRVRISDHSTVSAAEHARRVRWLAGW